MARLPDSGEEMRRFVLFACSPFVNFAKRSHFLPSLIVSDYATTSAHLDAVLESMHKNDLRLLEQHKKMFDLVLNEIFSQNVKIDEVREQFQSDIGI